jgi:WD40 repeat protein
VTGLAFRPGSHTLYSCSYDRSVKIWSLDDAAYVDTLFGHQVCWEWNCVVVVLCICLLGGGGLSLLTEVVGDDQHYHMCVQN